MNRAMAVIATAGHVDHGKSTLVHALTGTDPDRLPEERQRGLTTDLGFASCQLPTGTAAAFVDVPGHVRFLHNLLAGVGSVAGCLFVVAATEGWKPQSEEHLRILDILGIRHGVIALTKVARLDAAARGARVAEISGRVAGTFLKDAEIVEVDAPSGIGVDDLRSALTRLVSALPPAPDLDRPRLWIDRSFTIAGAGTVVTGTLIGGSLRAGEELALLPQPTSRGAARPDETAQPDGAIVPADGRRVRLRGLQRLHEPAPAIGPGERAAVNLTGVDRQAVARGMVLVRPRQWHAATAVDATLDVLASYGRSVSRRGAHLAYIGTTEAAVRVRVLGPEAIHAGSTGEVRLHLPVPLPLVAGDRYVLRDAGRDATIGGGELLDVAPVRPASRAASSDGARLGPVERVLRDRGWIDVDDLTRLTGCRRTPTLDRWVVTVDELRVARDRLHAELANAGRRGVDVATLDERDRALLATLDDVAVTGGRARRADIGDGLGADAYLEALAAQPFQPPPPPSGIDPAALRLLVQRGVVVERDGHYFAREAVDGAAQVMARLLDEHPEGVGIGAFRQALGTSRKWAVPLANLLDAGGITRRRGDLRISGPRLPAPTGQRDD